MAIVAKPQLRKPAAVAERRQAGAARPSGSKAAPAKRPAGFRPPSLPGAGRLAAPIEGRTAGLFEWVREVRSELRKCAWPTREEALRLTTVIIAISLIVGLVLGMFDALFAALMTGLLK